jgi:catechol 2,3-dioxygenase-like lactoylglutathione lyase family enzyme
MSNEKAAIGGIGIDRRRLLRGVGAGAAVLACGTLGRAAGAIAAETVNRAFVVTTMNHLSYASGNYKLTRDFYVDLLSMRNVWDDGTKCQLDCGPEDAPNTFYLTAAKPGIAPTVGHFSFGLPDFWNLKRELGEELMRRKLPGVHPDGEAGWFVNGPSGYVQHIVTVKDAAMFPGAAAPCEVARSAKCKDAYAAGLKNLDSVPRPTSQGFKALYFQYIVLRVSDVEREADFYRSLMGMKPVARRKDEVALRFGENTLVLRPAGADGKPSCNEFGFVVDNYDEAKVKAELERRGIAAKPNPAGGLMISDPNGLEVGIAGREYGLKT